jgi:hypothetical protein
MSEKFQFSSTIGAPEGRQIRKDILPGVYHAPENIQLSTDPESGDDIVGEDVELGGTTGSDDQDGVLSTGSYGQDFEEVEPTIIGRPHLGGRLAQPVRPGLHDYGYLKRPEST